MSKRLLKACINRSDTTLTIDSRKVTSAKELEKIMSRQAWLGSKAK
jgi:hypothetical protein